MSCYFNWQAFPSVFLTGRHVHLFFQLAGISICFFNWQACPSVFYTRRHMNFFHSINILKIFLLDIITNIYCLFLIRIVSGQKIDFLFLGLSCSIFHVDSKYRGFRSIRLRLDLQMTPESS